MLHLFMAYFYVTLVLDDIDDLIKVCLQSLTLLSMIVFTALQHLYPIFDLFLLSEQMLQCVKIFLFAVIVLLVFDDTLH